MVSVVILLALLACLAVPPGSLAQQSGHRPSRGSEKHRQDARLTLLAPEISTDPLSELKFQVAEPRNFAIQVAVSQANLHVEAFCTRCQPTVVATVTREGVVVGSGSTTVIANDEARSDTPVITQTGDVLNIAVDGETIAARTVTFPTANPVQCGSTTLTGSFDPSTPLLHAIAFHNGASEEVVPTASGNAYTANFARPFEADGGIAIEEAERDDTHSLPSYGPVDLVTHFSASVLCEASVDSDHDGIPDSADQCPTEAGPAPTGCPAAPGVNAPVAQCDVYWTKPRQSLSVPALVGVLSNDVDPAGSSLTAHVLSINFGISTHPYRLNPGTGALTYNPGPSGKSFKAVIVYRDTNVSGAVSNTTTATIWVQPNPPPASVYAACRPATFSTSKSKRPVYVALGDSYSAGEGACDANLKDCGYAPSTNELGKDECHRSSHSYPQLMAQRLKPSGWGFVNSTCSGAIINDISYSSHSWGSREPAQIETLHHHDNATEEVDLVTIGVGGNDMEFAKVLKDCVGAAAGGEAHCFQKNRPPVKVPSPPGNVSICAQAAIEVRLTCVYERVHAAAPAARLFVMGYPHLFAADPHHPDNCDLYAQDAEEITRFENAFNSQIEHAVAKANATDGQFAVFVSNAHTFDGHELCRKKGSPSYLHGWLPKGVLKLKAVDGHVESFHPNIEGQKALFNTLLEAAPF